MRKNSKLNKHQKWILNQLFDQNIDLYRKLSGDTRSKKAILQHFFDESVVGFKKINVQSAKKHFLSNALFDFFDYLESLFTKSTDAHEVYMFEKCFEVLIWFEKSF